MTTSRWETRNEGVIDGVRINQQNESFTMNTELYVWRFHCSTTYNNKNWKHPTYPTIMKKN